MKPSELINQVLADPTGQLQNALVKQMLVEPTGKLHNELIDELAEQAEYIWHALKRDVSNDEHNRLTQMARNIETLADALEALRRRPSVH